MIQDVIEGVLSSGLRAIVVRDLDVETWDGVRAWLEGELERRHWITYPGPVASNPRVVGFDVSKGTVSTRIAVVSVGLPEETFLGAEYRVTQYSMDDYMLRLAREEGLYSRVSELVELPHAKAMEKLSRTVDLLVENGIPIRHSKRLLHLLRGLAGFRASPAAFADRFLEEAVALLGPSGLRDRFLPLVGDLADAFALLER